MAATTRNLRLTVESLIAALHSSDPFTRLNVIGSLGCLGRKARRAVPCLLDALKDEHAAVRKQAALALGEIGSRASIRALRNALHDEDARVKRCATLALMNMGAEPTNLAA